MQISVNRLLLYVCGFIVVFDNFILWTELFQRIEVSEASGIGTVIGVLALLFVSVYVILVAFSQQAFLKVFLSIILLLSGIISYCLNMGVVFDEGMLTTVIDIIKGQNTQETGELWSLELLLHLCLFALAPIALLWLIHIKRQSFLKESANRIFVTLAVMVIAVVLIWPNMKSLTSFSRENRDLRYFVNPLFIINATYLYIDGAFYPSAKENVTEDVTEKLKPMSDDMNTKSLNE